MKNKQIITTITLALLLFFGNSVQFLLALDTPAAPGYSSSGGTGGETAPTGGDNIICQKEMTFFIANEETKYLQWIETNFNNKSSSGSLLDSAFGEYGDYRMSLYNKLYTYSPQKGFLQLTEGVEHSACQTLVDNALMRARMVLTQKARSTSTVKKTTALLTKYQQINDELAQLTQSFLDMKKYLDIFSDKLPCYIGKSCNKG